MFPQKSDLRHVKAFRNLAIGLLFASVFAIPPTAGAAKPPAQNSQLSIVATPKQVTAGRGVVITGKLKPKPNANQGIVLQANPFPFAGFVPLTTVNTDATGNYRFVDRPRLNTRYRVQTTTVTPAQTSAELMVLVAPRISFSLSDRTPRSGQLVRFYGRVWPAHDGRTAHIQRRTATGSWRTIARVLLRDDGDARSKYTRRIRIRTNGTFRVRLLADTDHATGLSTARFIRVH